MFACRYDPTMATGSARSLSDGRFGRDRPECDIFHGTPRGSASFTPPWLTRRGDPCGRQTVVRTRERRETRYPHVVFPDRDPVCTAVTPPGVERVVLSALDQGLGVETLGVAGELIEGDLDFVTVGETGDQGKLATSGQDVGP